MKTSLLAGALTLVIMNLPTVMRTTQESLKTVPQSYREGAFGLGRGEVARDSHGGAARLRGRRDHRLHPVGRPHPRRESAALLFTAGFAHTLYGFFDGLGSAGATLTVALYVYAKEEGEFERGIRHRRHPDDSDRPHQPCRHAGRQVLQEKEKPMSIITTVEDLCLWYGTSQALKNINIEHPSKTASRR